MQSRRRCKCRQQRYEWAQEAIADIGAQPDAKWKLQRAKMAGDMIDTLLAEIHAAVPELMAETFSDAWSRLEAHLAGKPEGTADPEKDGQEEEEARRQKKFVCLCR